MTRGTTDIGEEYLESGLSDGDTITFLLFDDSTDNIQEPDDLADISTELDNTNSYARQSSTVSTSQLSGSGNGDWGYQTDSDIVFDLSTNTETFDAIGYIANFDSTVAGDGGTATDHLIAVDTLSATYNAGDRDEITFNAGDIEHKIS
jgi:hypothetical protein